jgi:hypothetical protein
MVLARLALIPAVIGITFVACSVNTMGPGGNVHIIVGLNATEGSPGHDIVVKAQVVNESLQPVTYVTGCAAGPAIRIAILAEGETQPFDPCSCSTPCPRPACADQTETLVRGATVEGAATFDGTRLNCDGTFSAPPGRYTVVATFVGKGSNSRTITLSESKTFDWSAR